MINNLYQSKYMQKDEHSPLIIDLQYMDIVEMGQAHSIDNKYELWV